MKVSLVLILAPAQFFEGCLDNQLLDAVVALVGFTIEGWEVQEG